MKVLGSNILLNRIEEEVKQEKSIIIKLDDKPKYLYEVCAIGPEVKNVFLNDKVIANFHKMQLVKNTDEETLYVINESDVLAIL